LQSNQQSDRISDRMEKLLLFFSNGITPESSLDEFRRTPLFNILILLGFTFFLIFGVVTISSGNTLFGIGEIGVATTLFATFILTRNKPVPRWASSTVLLVFYFAFLFLGVTGGPDGNGYLWMYTFPAAAMFLTGPKIGTIWSLSLVAFLFGITSALQGATHVISYDNSHFLRIAGSYTLVVLFTAATDVVLIYSFVKIREIQVRLETTIAELNESREELQQQAIHDGLTGVFNRRFFNQTITTWTIQAQRHHSHTALLMIDVDNFKKYNDRFGHLKGDMVLKTVAETIQGVLRRESDMVFRFGGEEFTVLLTKTTDETTRKITESILHSIRRCNIPHPDSATGTVSVSIGVAEWDPTVESIFTEDFIEIADSAMYDAKMAGRARIIYRSCDLTGDDHRKTTAIVSID